MKIKGEGNCRETWICVCGNTVKVKGFSPCDSEGEVVEPTPDDWVTGWFVCEQCGRMIDQHTLDVVGLGPLSLVIFTREELYRIGETEVMPYWRSQGID